ncbi:MAG: M15 family metallopeptidase [Actinomycetota bacterium]
MRRRAIRRIGLLSTAVLLASVAPVTTAGSQETFFAEVSRLSPALKERMRGVSWHEGCPVPLHKLRLMRVSFHNFDGERRIGRLVAHRDATDAMVAALRSMWRNDFRIRRMHLVETYDGNDRRTMRADNTSAFNCRFVAGTTRWSQHAYGRAIDINPVENPYVGSDGSVSPREGREYVDRSQRRRGMIHDGDPVVRAFRRQGWGWGGHWSSSKDYMHFSATGT